MIVGSVSCLIREIWLVARYPLVGVGSAEMPMDLCQLTDEVFCTQTPVALLVLLYGCHKRGMNVETAGHGDLSFVIAVYTHSSFIESVGQGGYAY